MPLRVSGLESSQYAEQETWSELLKIIRTAKFRQRKEEVAIEKLLAFFILYCEDFIAVDEYEELLHTCFMKNTCDALLLELEWNSSDIIQSAVLICGYCEKHRNFFDCNLFGKTLFNRLQALFEQNKSNLSWFAKKMYCLWQALPPWIQGVEPFYSLCYADDPLSWGDIEQVQNIYEELLYFYD